MNLSKRNVLMKIKELKTDIGVIKDLELSFGRVFEEVWEEPMGPTPFPSLTTLRPWDMKLLNRYKPMYLPFCDLCCFCTFGKCDLTAGKRGACGIDIAAHSSRFLLLSCCIGSSTHIGHARHMVDYLIMKYGRRHPINVGGLNVEVEAPVIRLVCGIKPEILGDLEDALNYVENQLTHLLSTIHIGQEGSHVDFESKILHAGMIDHVALEIADVAQVSALGFPKADPEAPLVDLGLGTIDTQKPVILCIGHNVLPAANVVDYLSERGLRDEVEVCGLCCTAHDVTRYDVKAKIVGPIIWQLRFVRSGVPDVVIIDEQCVRSDIFDEAQKIKAPVIMTTEKICMGVPNRTGDPADEIVEDLVSGRVPGVLILDPEKVGEVAVKTALQVAPVRNKFKSIPDVNEIIESSKPCVNCTTFECRRSCPNNLPIPASLKAAADANLEKLAELYEACISCGRCEEVCPSHQPIISFIMKACETKLKNEIFKVRAGRGAIQDVEIRNVGSPIVLGEIPGVIAFVGCANYPNGERDVAKMCMTFANRRYIVVASGCAAMSIGRYKNEEGKTLYEMFPGDFEAGGIVNVGSCVANSHIAGAVIKIASIFAKRRLRANYEEIADYILNRVGAVGVAWGAMSQKASAIANGFNRLGVPVIAGPQGIKYRRLALGRRENVEDWYVYDARTGERVYVGPVPEHLYYVAETKEEAMVMIAKLCMRANDTTKGRAIKLTHYIDLHRRFFGTVPDDIHLFVRTQADIPITMKDEILEILKEKRWKERIVPDPTLLPRMIRRRKEEP
jgi:acetyl-CoA decarbonylase/synthase complex subunit alpha